jgi:aminoglycoside/choline kinase family phosphotransferase
MGEGPGVRLNVMDGYISETLAALFHTRFGESALAVSPLKGDGSDRRIHRISGDHQSAIAIYGPNLAENRAFLGFTQTFLKHGLPVPELYTVSDDEAFYLETDFGDVTLYDWQKARRIGDEFPQEVFAMYARVLRILPEFQIRAGKNIDYTLCYQYPEFAEDAMWFDVRYFEEMFLGQFPVGEINRAAFAEECSRIIAWLCRADRLHFLYRDFQSRNIMITDGEPHFLDYQSGRRGALQYDAASLLYDANAELPEDIRRRLLEVYIDAIETDSLLERSSFIELFDGFAILRVMQALGAFGNLGLRKNKRRFLGSIPSALRNLATLTARAAVMSDLPYLRSLFARIATDSTLHTITEDYERTPN